MLILGLCLFLCYLGFHLYFYDTWGISVGYVFFAVFVVPESWLYPPLTGVFFQWSTAYFWGPCWKWPGFSEEMHLVEYCRFFTETDMLRKRSCKNQAVVGLHIENISLSKGVCVEKLFIPTCALLCTFLLQNQGRIWCQRGHCRTCAMTHLSIPLRPSRTASSFLVRVFLRASAV